MNSSRLKLTEIFCSLQGEADSVGVPTIFVRLTGCPLRCSYCDTAYAFHGGNWWALPDILSRVKELEATYVCVTGGEPLAQPAVFELMTALCDAGYRVSVETSGAMPLEQVDPRVVKVVDIKTPASGEEARNRYDELTHLTATDLVKFVIANRDDYEWSRSQLRERGLVGRCTVLFSPSHSELPARDLAEWILEDRLPVRFQVQLHKYLWGDVPGR
ncbi:MAG: 7-carboxy-7-deazaguanine synthase QueE [Gammaproteobacteria bacterium]|nr:7-carboxy-7-deazaguanine synthase QueE [Gammaproteobacteria bacterium]